jgi:hypothetical protein
MLIDKSASDVSSSIGSPFDICCSSTHSTHAAVVQHHDFSELHAQQRKPQHAPISNSVYRFSQVSWNHSNKLHAKIPGGTGSQEPNLQCQLKKNTLKHP